MNYVDNIGFCKCGAVTITFEGESSSISMSKETYEEKYEGNLYFVQDHDEFKWHGCNHCINHWGVDLCACGSGELPDECDNAYECCGTPMQYDDISGINDEC